MVSQKLLWYSTVFFAEFLGSAFFVFVGCLGDVDKSPYFDSSLLKSSISWGMAVMIGVSSFGAISGGFMTPLITLAAFIHKVLDSTTALIYFAAQLIGSFFGYAVLRSIIPNDFLSNPNEFCVIQPKLSLQSSFIMEFIVSFIFIIFLSSVLDPRNKNLKDSLAIKFGFIIFVMHLTAGPLSGAGVNPARSFAPAFYNQVWKNQWLYWLAPFSAATASSLFYKFFFAKDYKKIPEDDLNLEGGNTTKR